MGVSDSYFVRSSNSGNFAPGQESDIMLKARFLSDKGGCSSKCVLHT